MSHSLKSWKRESRLMLGLVALLSLLLVVLAVLQYHWLNQLRDANHEQRKGMLNAAAVRFSKDFDRELSSIFISFRPFSSHPSETEESGYAAKYRRWVSAAQFPHLIREVWLASEDRYGSFALKELEPISGEFRPHSWPSEMNRIRRDLERQTADLRKAFGQPSREGEEREGGMLSQHMRLVSKDPLALIVPLLEPPVMSAAKKVTFPAPHSFIIAVLDWDCIRQEILPALVRRNFTADTELNCRITVVSRDDPNSPIFRTSPALLNGTYSKEMAPAAALTEADIAIGLFEWPLGRFPPSMLNRSPDERYVFGEKQTALTGSAHSDRRFPDLATLDSGRGMNGIETTDRGSGLWLLLVQQGEGSLTAGGSKAHRSNLALSFSILLLLAGSIVMIVVSTRRARRLVQQQIEFIAGVTHELRTPIAVICSAGENLADGVVTERIQISRYGTLIRDSGRRLAGMIEQVLDFAAWQSGRRPEDLEIVDAADLIHKAILASLPDLEARDFQLEQEITPGLPAVKGSESALCLALQNLLSNSLKYSGNSRWIGLKALVCPNKAGGEVKITVEDRGIGIPAEDLPQIFDPFFRAKNADTARIHGNGLGLAVARSIVEAHGGRICASSVVGRGSVFSIYLPAIDLQSQADITATQP